MYAGLQYILLFGLWKWMSRVIVLIFQNIFRNWFNKRCGTAYKNNANTFLEFGGGVSPIRSFSTKQGKNKQRPS